MSSEPLANERELFMRIAGGDEQAFQTVFHYYTQELLPFIFKLTGSREMAEEVIQDIFLHLWQQRGKLAGVETPKAWIVRMASNTAINYLRKKAADGRLYDVLKDRPVFNATPENELAAREMARRIGEAVMRLTPAERKVYELSRERGMPIPEIAASLGVSPNTVKNQLTAALKSIRAAVAKGTHLLWSVFFILF